MRDAAHANALSCVTSRYWASGSVDFDTLADRMEHNCAEAVDVLVQGLERDQRSSVMHVHLGVRWLSTMRDLGISYSKARETLSSQLLRRGIS